MLPKKSEIMIDVQRALAEDIGTGDITSALLSQNLQVKAMIISREPMLVCGSLWVNCAFYAVDPTIQINWLVSEGEWLQEAATLCYIYGTARNILTAERTALNFLQTLSATATETHHYVKQLQGHNARLLDTRKTIPGLRLAQKYAVRCGGGVNHRMGLYDAFLIKENHIKACGSITNAVAKAKALQGILVEVEVETLAQLSEALKAAPDRILLDNFTQEMLVEAVKMNQPRQCELEVSGGVNLQTIQDIAGTGVDYISVGAITKSIKAIDLSLLLQDDV